MLTLDRISKYHGANPILLDVTLGVPPGARIGVVGPNGVGKSTLLRIAAGMEEADAGTVTRAPGWLTVGYMPQEQNGRATLSGGQAARKALDAVLTAELDVLLLDEPTNNLDYEGLARLERFMRTSSASIVVVSHDREFLDRTVTRVLELDEWTRQAKDTQAAGANTRPRATARGAGNTRAGRARSRSAAASSSRRRGCASGRSAVTARAARRRSRRT